MTDTDFYVPDGSLLAQEGFGGGGLIASTMDYIRFSQMMLNGGELDGVRILAPLTVKLMASNHLPEGVEGLVSYANSATKFGLDFAVIEDPIRAEAYSEGEYYWGGVAGTWFRIDPVENLVFIGMIQQFGQGIPDVRGTGKLYFRTFSMLFKYHS